MVESGDSGCSASILGSQLGSSDLKVDSYQKWEGRGREDEGMQVYRPERQGMVVSWPPNLVLAYVIIDYR